MTRALSVALLLFCAAPAFAKTALVGSYVDRLDASYGFSETEVTKTRMRVLQNVLGLFGASYIVIPPEIIKTEWARSGQMTWEFASSAARNETFNALVDANFCVRSGSPNIPGWRPDSLSTVAKITTTPLLLLGSHDARQALGTDDVVYGRTTACSVGVAASVAQEGAGGGSGTHDEEGVYYQSAAQTDAFLGTENVGRQVTSAATVAGKGYRPLLSHGSGPIGVHHGGATAWQVWSSQWDSTGRQTTPDTVQAWMVQNTHVSTAKPIICAVVNDIAGDAGGGLAVSEITLDIPTLLISLAALDSAASGQVFDNDSKLPLKVAVTIDGLCSRSAKTNSGGIVPSDTARFYASLDSIGALDIPVTFGVNADRDSMAAYSRDLIYAASAIPKARFAPSVRTGIDSAVAGNGITSRYRMRDPFGRFRNRAAYGDGTCTGADTSLTCNLIWARAALDSMLAALGHPGRISRFLIAPDDDWSPYNLRANQAGPTVDSVLYAFRKAGHRGVRINGGWDVGRPNLNPSNPRGYIPNQQSVRIRYGTTEVGDDFKLLAYNGGSTMGTIAIFSGASDSTQGVTADHPPSHGWSAQSRFWKGLFIPGSGATGSDGENATGEVQRGSIFRLSCQELAGSAVNASWKETVRPSWWALKQVVMPIRIMNRLAGRSIMTVTYPEDIDL